MKEKCYIDDDSTFGWAVIGGATAIAAEAAAIQLLYHDVVLTIAATVARGGLGMFSALGGGFCVSEAAEKLRNWRNKRSFRNFIQNHYESGDRIFIESDFELPHVSPVECFSIDDDYKRKWKMLPEPNYYLKRNGEFYKFQLKDKSDKIKGSIKYVRRIENSWMKSVPERIIEFSDIAKNNFGGDIEIIYHEQVEEFFERYEKYKTS